MCSPNVVDRKEKKGKEKRKERKKEKTTVLLIKGKKGHAFLLVYSSCRWKRKEKRRKERKKEKKRKERKEGRSSFSRRDQNNLVAFKTRYIKMATVSLKLLVDNSTKKVILAEAGKDFVDFLFGMLEIPLGSLLSLLAAGGMCESWTLSKVYESVNKLGNEYLQPDQTKKSLLNPDMPYSNTPLMQQLGFRKPQSSIGFNTSSPFPAFGGPTRSDDRKEVYGYGYVKGSVTYMISDDLTVKPVSSISTISLINSLGVKDIGTLEEKMVDVDMKKALELVRTSFGSNTVLTDVFVGKTVKKCE